MPVTWTAAAAALFSEKQRKIEIRLPLFSSPFFSRYLVNQFLSFHLPLLIIIISCSLTVPTFSPPFSSELLPSFRHTAAQLRSTHIWHRRRKSGQLVQLVLLLLLLINCFLAPKSFWSLWSCSGRKSVVKCCCCTAALLHCYLLSALLPRLNSRSSGKSVFADTRWSHFKQKWTQQRTQHSKKHPTAAAAAAHLCGVTLFRVIISSRWAPDERISVANTFTWQS